MGIEKFVQTLIMGGLDYKGDCKAYRPERAQPRKVELCGLM